MRRSSAVPLILGLCCGCPAKDEPPTSQSRAESRAKAEPFRRAPVEFNRYLAGALAPFEADLGRPSLTKDGVTIGDLQLRPSVLDDEDGQLHVHVQMAVQNSRPLEACLSGLGESPAERLEHGAVGFVERAFTVFAAATQDRARPGGYPFAGDEPWAVPGSRGYVGNVAFLGETPIEQDSLNALPLFDGLSGVLPHDGVHVVKVTAHQLDGEWKRTVELDGDDVVLPESPFELSSPVTPVVLFRFAVILGPSEQTKTELVGKYETSLPDWLPQASCDLEAVPQAFDDTWFIPGACLGWAAPDCLKWCESGDASYCYNAAVSLQASAPKLSGALYAKACRHGAASGCTNLAAGTEPIGPCEAETFRRACEFGEDPWGCAMFAFALARGMGTDTDIERAKEFASRACKGVNELDPACAAATAVLDGSLEAQHDEN